MPLLRPEERIGSVIAERYRLDEILGKGGMGVVFKGVHTWNNRPIAVKVLLPQFTEDDEILARFQREAEAVAALDHPNVVEVLDSGEDDEGDAYMVLELLQGESLAERLQREGLISLEDTLAVMVPVLDGLVFAHERGVIHRDLKPDNIFLSRDARDRQIPKLLDFGVAKLAASTGSLATRTGSVLGTPQYMSPEQAGVGGEVGAASDIWSMAVVMYRCLTGTLPFEGDTMAKLLVQVATGPSVSLRRAAPKVPEPIAKVVDRALERDLAKRYGETREFLEALRQAARVVGWEVGIEGGVSELRASQRPAPKLSEPAGPPVAEADSEVEAETEEKTEEKTESEAVAEPAPELEAAADAPLEAQAERMRGAASEERVLAASRPKRSNVPYAIGATVVAAAAIAGVYFLAGSGPVERTVSTEPPGAQISVDGEVVGETPYTMSVEEDRSRDVRIELEGHWPEHLYVSVSDPEHIEVELRPNEAQTVQRRIETTPPGARVIVDGEDRGVTPIDLTVSSERSLVVQIQSDAHWAERLYVSVSDPDVIEVTLRAREDAQSANRHVDTEPSGAHVTVDGEDRGVTPVELTVSTERSLDVRLELDGYWPEQRYLSVSDPPEVLVPMRPRRE